MRIFDQRAYGTATGMSQPSSIRNRSWMMFLMQGQEPKSFSAAAQVFDVSDLYYLYNECIGIVPDVVFPSSSSATDGSIIQMQKSAEVWYKGYSYFDGTKSIAIPDRISGAASDLSTLFGSPDRSVNAVAVLDEITLHYTNPVNFVGFAIDKESQSGSPNMPKVSIDSVPVTLTRQGNILTLPNIVTGQTITIKETTTGNHRVPRITPLTADLGTGAAPVPTYYVLAPTSLNDFLQWGNIPEIPYLLTSLTFDTEEESSVYILGTVREKKITAVCRDIILGPMEA